MFSIRQPCGCSFRGGIFDLQLLLVEFGLSLARGCAGLGAAGHHDDEVTVLVGLSQVAAGVRGQGLLRHEGELGEDGGVPLDDVFLLGLEEVTVDDGRVLTKACLSAFWKL